MAALRIESVEDPFQTDQALATEALRLIFRAEFLGCLPADDAVTLGPELVRSVGRCLQRAHLPSARWQVVLRADTEQISGRWHEILAAMNDQIEMSPLPSGEWHPAVAALGEDLVARLLGISASSLRRYQAAARPTPQDVAERLHFLALLLADLAGSYNDYGMRRWFTRPRAALDGRRPADLLGGDFDPDGPDGETLHELAASLIAAGAA